MKERKNQEDELRDQVEGELLIVGPGAYFLSGISYHLAAIACAFRDQNLPVSAMLVRRLIPRKVYPGRERVGQHDNGVLKMDGIPTYEGLDWHGGIDTLRALQFLRQRRPSTVLFQWWTAATAHNYYLLARAAKHYGAKVIFEMHEVGDVGNTSSSVLESYSALAIKALSPYIDALVVHSEHDGREIPSMHRTLTQPYAVIPPGPLGHGEGVRLNRRKRQSDEPVRLLYFGVLRPYKGVEELVEAFIDLRSEGCDYHLMVAGEDWGDASTALEKLEPNAPPDAYTLRLEYVPDEEVPHLFAEADMVVLPYHRASASGPIHLTLEAGLPLVTTDIPALREVCSEYALAEFAAPKNPASLAEAISRATEHVGKTGENHHSWERNVGRYTDLFASLRSN